MIVFMKKKEADDDMDCTIYFDVVRRLSLCCHTSTILFNWILFDVCAVVLDKL